MALFPAINVASTVAVFARQLQLIEVFFEPSEAIRDFMIICKYLERRFPNFGIKSKK